MDIEIRPLTADTSADFFDFFDNRAFTDHQEWSFCYCTYMHVDSEYEQAVEKIVKAEGVGAEVLRGMLRGKAARLIEDGVLRGYLAYADGVPIGWCNAHDKAMFKRFDHGKAATEFIRSHGGGGRVKSVVCFTIAPGHRGKGIATALLNRVVADARAEGYDAVEAYARRHTAREPFDYYGPYELLEKAGFTAAADESGIVIMRKETEK